MFQFLISYFYFSQSAHVNRSIILSDSICNIHRDGLNARVHESFDLAVIPRIMGQDGGAGVVFAETSRRDEAVA